MQKEVSYIDPKTVKIIGLDTDHRAEDHALFDERSFLETNEALIRNIMVYGVQQPVVVREEGGELVVVDGRQRVKATREAAKRQSEAGHLQVLLPVIKVEGDDLRVAGIMASNNEQRTATEILEKANNAARLVDMQGASMADLEIIFGKSRTTLKGWLDLAKASPKIHAALNSNKIGAAAAVQLAKLATREEQEAELEKLLGSGERISEAKAKKARQEATGTTASDTKAAKAAPAPKAGKAGKAGKASKKTVTTTATGKKATAARKAVQSGIKRTWLRKAVDKTEAAKKLEADQLGVLRWFAYGESKKGDWFDTFMIDAEVELGESSVGE